MLDSHWLEHPIRACSQGAGLILVLLALPLAAPVLAESVSLAGAEKESVSKDSVECLAWAGESRPTRRRTTRAADRTALIDCRFSDGRSRLSRRMVNSGHRLPNGSCAPLRC